MASQDQDKVSANLLRKSLRDSADACPEPDILAAYFERSLDAGETARYELHFSQCARCREQLAAMHRAGEASPAGRAETRQASHWAWLWDWRVLAPVAAVLVLAAVWLARRPATNQVAEVKSQSPLVAMSQPSEPPATAALPPEPKVAVPTANYSGTPAAKPVQDLDSVKKQSQTSEGSGALNDKEQFAANLPQTARDETRSAELAKDDRALKHDSADTATNVVVEGAASRIVAPATPSPALTPPVSGAGGVPAGNAERVTVASESDIVAPASAATKSKPSGAPAAMRTLTQQAQTQTVMQSKALALEAVDTRSAGNIITTPDPKVLWRIAEAGFVEHSTDGGASWQGQLPNENAQLAAGSAPSAKICWLVGRDGVILLTKDAKNWKTIPAPVTADFVGVTAQDASSATVLSADGRKFTTTDGGNHWKSAP